MQTAGEEKNKELSVDAAAIELDLKRDTMWLYGHTEVIPCHRDANKKMLFWLSDLRDYHDKHQAGPQAKSSPVSKTKSVKEQKGAKEMKAKEKETEGDRAYSEAEVKAAMQELAKTQQPIPPGVQIYSIEEIAQILGIQIVTVPDYVRKFKLPNRRGDIRDDKWQGTFHFCEDDVVRYFKLHPKAYQKVQLLNKAAQLAQLIEGGAKEIPVQVASIWNEKDEKAEQETETVAAVIAKETSMKKETESAVLTEPTEPTEQEPAEETGERTQSLVVTPPEQTCILNAPTTSATLATQTEMQPEVLAEGEVMHALILFLLRSVPDAVKVPGVMETTPPAVRTWDAQIQTKTGFIECEAVRDEYGNFSIQRSHS